MKDKARQGTLEHWLATHTGLIHKVIRAYAFTAHDREDLLQEIALQLWDSIPRFKQESAVTTWIYRVALYSSIAWSKRERNHSDRAQALEQAPPQESVQPEEDPRIAWLYGQIATLELIDRSLVLLLLEGMTYFEMANTLGISEKNVSVKLHRIKKTLAQRSDRNGNNNGL